MTIEERDKKAYQLAREYLLQFGEHGVTPDLLEKYLHESETTPRPQTIAGIYERILQSAQNANMKAGVIGKAIGGVERLSSVLHGFEPGRVNAAYSDWKQVLKAIKTELKPKGKIRQTRRSIWPQYCRSILSGARFMMQFSTADDFFKWVDFFDRDDRARVALPLLLEREIEGFGFALACDFLKELGYINFAKPDVHVRDIFVGLRLCPADADDYEVFKAAVRLAKHVGVTPYNADKLFWLIGSGYFYLDEHMGNGGRIGSKKREFITWARRKLGE